MKFLQNPFRFPLTRSCLIPLFLGPLPRGRRRGSLRCILRRTVVHRSSTRSLQVQWLHCSCRRTLIRHASSLANLESAMLRLASSCHQYEGSFLRCFLTSNSSFAPVSRQDSSWIAFACSSPHLPPSSSLRRCHYASRLVRIRHRTQQRRHQEATPR